MAESVDALVSNTSGAIHPGSIPGLGTSKTAKKLNKLLAVFFFYAAKSKNCTKNGEIIHPTHHKPVFIHIFANIKKKTTKNP